MTLADLSAALMLAGLVTYSLLGGADFGGGVWDLLAGGPRAGRQRKLIEAALAPVWEANHVWLIFVIVVMFTAFPTAFSVIGTALHVPLAIMLLGIVFRGSAFVFRQYGGYQGRGEARWGRVFAIASVITPVFLGVTLGAVTAGDLRLVDGYPADGFFRPWLRPVPFAVGLFALALFAYLAAVYLTIEATEPDLQDDFRRRAIGAWAAVVVVGTGLALALRHDVRPFEGGVLGDAFTWTLRVAAALVTAGALGALWRRRFRAARVLAIAQVILVVGGWALAQYPLLVAPDVTIASAAAPRATLALLIPVAIAGSAILLPSLYYLFRVFKGRRR